MLFEHLEAEDLVSHSACAPLANTSSHGHHLARLICVITCPKELHHASRLRNAICNAEDATPHMVQFLEGLKVHLGFAIRLSPIAEKV